MHELATILVFGVFTASLLSIGSVGFTLQFGVTNVLNLAYGALMTSGIFVMYLAVQLGVPVGLSVLIAGVWGALISLLLSSGVINPYMRRGTSLFGMAMVTIAVALVVQYTLEAIQGPTLLAFPEQGSGLLDVAGVALSYLQVAIVVTAAALLLLVHALLKYSRLGLAMRATAADPALTRACGVSTVRVRSIAWMVSGALCGIAGGLLGLTQGAFNSVTGNEFFIVVVAAAIVGGIGQPYGGMLGALAIGLVTEAAATYLSPSYKDIVAFAVLVLVLLLRPQGLIAEFSSGRELVQ